MTLHLYIDAKFRIFGLTLGSLTRSFTVGFDLVTRQFSFTEDASPPPSTARTLMDERGVLVRVWA